MTYKLLRPSVFTVLFSFILAAAAFGQEGQWSVMFQSEVKILRAVWGSGDGTVFAVGDGGTALKYDGIKWSPMASGTDRDLLAIWGHSEAGVFAAGEGGTILRYGGSGWHPMKSGTDETLRALWGSSGASVFAAGDNGTILRYDGITWQPMTSGTHVTLHALWGASGVDVFAAGGNGTILHYEGWGWYPMEVSTKPFLRTIWGSSGSDVFAAGGSTVLHYDGRKWEQTETAFLNLYSLWGSSSSDMFIGGMELGSERGIIWHYDGTETHETDMGTDVPVYGLWGSSGNDVFAVGGNPEKGGTILRYDGKSWQQVWQQPDEGLTGDLEGVWGRSGSDLFAVGKNGVVMHYNGENWQKMISPTTNWLRDVRGYSDGSVFAVGASGTVLRYDGRDWQTMESGTEADLYALWGTADSGLFAVGDEGTILRYDGAAWHPMESGTRERLEGIWGTSATDIWAAGHNGTLLRYDGKKWYSVNSGTGIHIYTIWGTSATDIYAAGHSRLFLHYDGWKWDSEQLNAEVSFNGLAGFSEADVLGVGYNGMILHYDGDQWESMNSGIVKSLISIWTVPAQDGVVSEAFAVGDNGIILHYSALTLILPESAEEGAGNITGTLKVRTALSEALRVSLSSDDASEITVPESVTIPAGKTEAEFMMTVSDDIVLDGTQRVRITASASGHNPGNAVMRVSDNEMAVLTVILPAVVNERDGLLSEQGTVSVSVPVEKEVAISLRSDNPDAARVPPTVTIQLGQTDGTFDLLATDDTEIDDPQVAVITASVPGWTSGSATVRVEDDDRYGLTLSLPEFAEEADGVMSGAGRVSVPLPFPSDIAVRLSSHDPSEVTVPESVTIPAGETSAAFDLFPVRDALSDDPQTAVISASSPGFAGDYSTIEIRDSDSRWASMEKGTSGLESVWGSSPSDVFAVGDYGLILHYDGTEWRSMDNVAEKKADAGNLKRVWGSSGTDVFTVGNYGTILHYDGKEWQVMESNTEIALYSVWGTSGSDVFAVGGSSNAGGVILHYDGTTWQVMQAGLREKLASVWGSSGTDVFAVGSKGLILHYDGVEWKEMNSDTNNTLRCVGGISGSDVFAVGSNAILRYDGTEWHPMEGGAGKSLYGLWAASASDIFAIGNKGTILRYDGTEWQETESGTDKKLRGIWGIPANGKASDIFAVGTNGVILRYDSTAWEADREADLDFNGIWSISGETDSCDCAWAVGEDGLISHYDGTEWQQTEKGFFPDLYSVWGRSASEIFAVGEGGTVLRYDGIKWRRMSNRTYEHLCDVRGLPPESGIDVFAAGDKGTVLHYDGAQWHMMTTGTTIKFKGIWPVPAASGDGYELFVVGTDGVILHYDGKDWMPMESGTAKDLNAIWGASARALFAVGSSGTVLRYDGREWNTMESIRSSTLRGVWGTSASDLFVVGYNGTALHYDGVRWIQMNVPNLPLYAVWGRSGSDVFVVGKNNTILHYSAVELAVPPNAAEGDGLLSGQGRVSVKKAPESDMVIRLTSHTPSEVTVPDTVTIPAGETSAVFDLTISDDNLRDGSQRVRITAAADGYSLGTDIIWVRDNETAALSLTLPASAAEGDGLLEGQGTVTMDGIAGKDVIISLTSDNTDEIRVPPEVVIPAGAASAAFDITVADDIVFDDTRTATVTASVAGWTSGVSTMAVADNEVTELHLTMPSEVSENDGIISQAGVLSIPGTLTANLVVALSSDDLSEITVPETITLPAGQMSVNFDITVPDDPEIDGTQPVTVTASATGWTPAEAESEVADNDPGTVQFSSARYMAWEESGSVELTVLREQSSSGEVTVNYASEDKTAASGTDYTAVSGTLFFGEGEVRKTISVPVTADAATEGGETFKVILTGPGGDANLGEPDTAAVVITDAMTWQAEEAVLTESNLKDVWGSSETDIFAVGWRSTILHYDGVKWEDISPETGTGLQLEGVWGSSGSNVFAVGSDGVILRYDGNEWRPMASVTTRHLYGIWGNSASDIFAVGTNVILRYDGTAWHEIVPDAGETPDLRAVWGTSGSDVFAVGCEGSVLRYDGGSWRKMESSTEAHLYDVWGSSGSDVFAVGSYGTILHYDGAEWRTMDNGTDRFLLFLEGVRGNSGSDVFAAGDGGTVLHYDGQAWQEMTVGTDSAFSALWCPDGLGTALDLFAVGNAGAIWHYGPEMFSAP